ncbi:MAG TPA: biopolymer transporter ExbD [Rhodanobacteraceae bacterium]|nr:biopolymer transporter ExbD [Rhodanobacteraceae bacterium]
MAAISRLRLPDHRNMAEINITPLIDVMLALLLIFMLATPLLSSRLPLPQDSDPRPAPPPRRLELSIAADGQVLHAGYALSRLELQAELVAFASKGGAMSLQLRPDALTAHQYVITVLDAARGAGIRAIALESPAQ